MTVVRSLEAEAFQGFLEIKESIDKIQNALSQMKQALEKMEDFAWYSCCDKTQSYFYHPEDHE